MSDDTREPVSDPCPHCGGVGPGQEGRAAVEAYAEWLAKTSPGRATEDSERDLDASNQLVRSLRRGATRSQDKIDRLEARVAEAEDQADVHYSLAVRARTRLATLEIAATEAADAVLAYQRHMDGDGDGDWEDVWNATYLLRSALAPEEE